MRTTLGSARSRATKIALIAGASVAAMASAAVAQPANSSEDIVVTGSRIARPAISSPVPVVSLTAEDLDSGSLNVGDTLNSLPQLRSTFSQSNSTRFIGTSGLNILDLRGLGTSRTLVLVDGRRHITATPGDYQVDTNTIPDELIQRIDVVTGGNSAVYGSDAVAGVVNFIMKKDFEGLKVRGQGGISSRSDFGSYFGSVTWGKNSADGRANFAVAGEFSKNNALYFTQRDYLTGAFSGRSQFNLREPTAGEPAIGDGIVDNLFFNGVRNGNISNGGQILSAGCTVALLANPLRCQPGSTATNLIATSYVFTQDGQLIPNPVTTDLRIQTNGGSSNTIGGLGSTLRDTGQLFPKVQRESINIIAHYEVTPAFEPFFEGKFVRIKANQEGQPSFFQGSIPAFFGGGSNLRCDNPYLTAQQYAALQGMGRCGVAAFGTVNALTFNLSRFNVDFGGRGETHKRDTFRVVGGFRGTFNEDWKYEIAANYGQLKTRLDTVNNLFVFDDTLTFTGGPFLNALDVTRNASGQIVCRINAVTVTDPACAPLNPFGQGSPSAAALAYIHTPGFRDEKATELNFTGFVTGDLSQLFSLQGGPIAFTLGGEYRRETARSQWDPRTENGQTFLNALAPNFYPAFTVKEAFGELQLPLLADLPFAKQLTVSGAGRFSSYNTSAGNTWAWNVNGVWAPIEDLMFRAGYGKSVRVPTQSDLFDAQSQNFAFISDPCDVLFITGNANRPANCAADGVPVGFVNTPARSASLSFAQGGNPFLQSEIGKSLTVGGVLQPRWVPGLAINVDWYRIEVSNLIATLGAQTIINLCYDNPRPNQYCPLVSRNPVTFEFADPAVISGPVNFAKQITSGIDTEISYTHRFANGDRFGLSAIVGYLIRRDNYVNPTDARIVDRQKSELGDAPWEFTARASYNRGDWGVRWTTRFIGKSTVSTYEAQHPITNPCPTTGLTGFPLGSTNYPATCTPGQLAVLSPTNYDTLADPYYPIVMYHDVRFNYKVNKEWAVYFGIDNLADRKPPLGLLGTAGGDPYNTVGRYFYVGFDGNF